MSKMRRNRDVPHIGRGGADKAAAKGPAPEQAVSDHAPLLRGNGLQSVQDNSGVFLFSDTGQKLLVGTNKPLYKGFDLFQRLKLTTGGPKGTTDPRDL